MILLLQCRPSKRPDWWPLENGGWVTLNPVPGSGWMAGNHAGNAVPKGRTPRELAGHALEIIEAWLSDHDGRACSFRAVGIPEPGDELEDEPEAAEVPKKAARPRQRPATPRKGHGGHRDRARTCQGRSRKGR